MINKDVLTKQDTIYLYEGRSWQIFSYCPGPSVTMECVTSKEQINFGLGGELDRKFKKIEEVGKR